MVLCLYESPRLLGQDSVEGSVADVNTLRGSGAGDAVQDTQTCTR